MPSIAHYLVGGSQENFWQGYLFWPKNVGKKFRFRFNKRGIYFIANCTVT
jgi:hypothetical protein